MGLIARCKQKREIIDYKFEVEKEKIEKTNLYPHNLLLCRMPCPKKLYYNSSVSNSTLITSRS